MARPITCARCASRGATWRLCECLRQRSGAPRGWRVCRAGDNLRVPSGVSYMLANREVVRRAFPGVFRASGVRPIEHYPRELLSTLRSLAPFQEDVSIAVLTPGVFKLGLFRTCLPCAPDGRRTRRRPRSGGQRQCRLCAYDFGLKRIDVIYRRIDDDFIDPLIFRADSCSRRSRDLQCLSRGQCGDRQCARHRALPTTRRSMPMCRG